MSEIKLGGDFSAEVMVKGNWRDVIMDEGVVATSFWDTGVPLVLVMSSEDGEPKVRDGSLTAPKMSIVGHEEIDALRMYCEMILEHYRAEKDKW